METSRDGQAPDRRTYPVKTTTRPTCSLIFRVSVTIWPLHIEISSRSWVVD